MPQSWALKHNLTSSITQNLIHHPSNLNFLLILCRAAGGWSPSHHQLGTAGYHPGQLPVYQELADRLTFTFKSNKLRKPTSPWTAERSQRDQTPHRKNQTQAPLADLCATTLPWTVQSVMPLITKPRLLKSFLWSLSCYVQWICSIMQYLFQ